MSTRASLSDIRSRLPASTDKASVVLDIGNVYTRYDEVHGCMKGDITVHDPGVVCLGTLLLGT